MDYLDFLYKKLLFSALVKSIFEYCCSEKTLKRKKYAVN